MKASPRGTSPRSPLAGVELAAPAFAQDKTVKIGVLNDMSSLYADIGGPNSVVAIKMAIEDSGCSRKAGRSTSSAAITRTSPMSASTSRGSGSIATRSMRSPIRRTPASRSPSATSPRKRTRSAQFGRRLRRSHRQGLHAEHDLLHLRHLHARQRHRQGSHQVRRRHLVFLTADYAFGHALERDTSAVVTANGGKVLGGVKHPINTSDFSSFLLQAQASKAKVVGLANAGGDTTNAIKQASEFGIVAGGQKLAHCCCSSTTSIRWG